MSDKTPAPTAVKSSKSQISPLLFLQFLTLALAVAFAFVAVGTVWTDSASGLSDRQLLVALFNVLTNMSIALAAFLVSKFFGLMQNIPDDEPTE